MLVVSSTNIPLPALYLFPPMGESILASCRAIFCSTSILTLKCPLKYAPNFFTRNISPMLYKACCKGTYNVGMSYLNNLSFLRQGREGGDKTAWRSVIYLGDIRVTDNHEREAGQGSDFIDKVN